MPTRRNFNRQNWEYGNGVMLKQSWACFGYLCAPITQTPFAEFVRLSRASIADEMREEHQRRVLGD
jgi:hypothetical protein